MTDSAGEVPAAPQLPAETETPAIVVFDMDGTLVRGDCGDRYLRWLLRRNPLRQISAALIAPLALPMLRIAGTRRRAVSAFYWLATVGLSQSRLDERAAQFLREYRLRPIETAVAALREELSRGHRVVVATGALRVLADGLLRRMELRDQVELVASESTRWAGGQTVAAQCNGQQKVRRLQLQGFPAPYLRAYSDHHSDRWLLELADTPVLVNASPRDRQQLRQHFGKRLRIVLWT